MEQKPLLQRRKRQHLLDRRILALQPLDLILRERHQRQIARAAPASAGRIRMPNKPLQRCEPTFRQVTDLRLRHKRQRPGPVGHKPASLRLIKGERIDLNAVRKRHAGIAASAKPHSLRCTRPVRLRRRRKATEIVEANLRGRKIRKLQTSLLVQIAQQSVAKPVVGHRTQLLLDRLQRTTKSRPTRQSFLNINRPGIQPHREQAGEPPHRARKAETPNHHPRPPPPPPPIKPTPPTPPPAPAPTPPPTTQTQPRQKPQFHPPRQRRRPPAATAHPSGQPAASASADPPSPSRREPDQASPQPATATACSASQSKTKAPQRSPQPAPATKAAAPNAETTSHAPPAQPLLPAQSPPTQPQDQAPGCATTLRQHTNDE